MAGGDHGPAPAGPAARPAGPGAPAPPPAEAAVLAAIRQRPLPRHVALIMDGNGRWAAARHLPRVAGHREGVKAARRAVRAAGELGLEVLTLYAFSSENWSRPAPEVNFLMRLLESSTEAELPELVRNNIRLRILGDRAALVDGVGRAMDRATQATAGNTGLTLQIALNYGSRQELCRAMRVLAGRVARGELAPESIDEALVSATLDTAGLPDPDLLVRTSGEHRLSNFLLWQAAYTELLVLPVLWPDFSAAHLYQAVAEFQGRSRRFGGL